MFKTHNLKGVICVSVLISILFAPAALLAQVPTEAEVHNRLGNEYCDRGEFNKAIKEYEEAARIYPKYIDAYYNLGVTYYHDLKDYQKAAHYFQKFLEYESDTPDAQQMHKWLADIEKTHGITPAPPASEKKARAVEAKAVEEVKKVTPPPPPIKPIITPSQAKPVLQEPQAKPLKKATEYKENRYKKALAHKNRGNIYSKDGKFQMAVREYLKAVELRPDFTDAIYNLAKTYDFDLNDDEKAIKYYEIFLKHEPPNSPDAKEVKTWLLKAKMSLAKGKVAPSEKKVAKAKTELPVQKATPVTRPPASLLGARFEDRPFTKGLLDSPVQVASVTPDKPLVPEPKKVTPPPPPQVPVTLPSPPPLAPAVESILLTSYLPKDLKSVQTSILLRAEMRNELLDIFRSKRASDPDKLAQLFLTKLRQDTLPNGDEIANIEVSGELLANIRNIHILSHRDRIELNNEKGNLFRSPQTVQTRKRLQTINEILENGFEITHE